MNTNKKKELYSFIEQKQTKKAIVYFVLSAKQRKAKQNSGQIQVYYF